MNKHKDIFKLTHNNIQPKPGKVLVSEPFGSEGVFNRSVILLAEHNEEGTVGFILNKPLPKKVSDFSSELRNIDTNMALGGPVSSKRIYYIHTYGDKIPGSIYIKKGLYWGGNFDVLRAMSEEGVLDENKVRFFLGYSGWEPKQLTNEIKKDYWLVSEIDVKTIMGNNHKIWQKTVSALEKPYSAWQYFPVNPNLN